MLPATYRGIKMAQANSNKKPATKPAGGSTLVTLQAASATATAVPNAPIAASVRLAAGIATGVLVPNATALAHKVVGAVNTAGCATGQLVISAKGQVYKPKPGANTTMWAAILAQLAAGNCTAATIATALGGAAHANYRITTLALLQPSK